MAGEWDGEWISDSGQWSGVEDAASCGLCGNFEGNGGDGEEVNFGGFLELEWTGGDGASAGCTAPANVGPLLSVQFLRLVFGNIWPFSK